MEKLRMENKSERIRIEIRIEKEKKKLWKKFCSERQVSLTQLIINSVENRMMDNERRKVLKFIEKQDNIFIKIETNINQIARIANLQKFVSEKDLRNFSQKLAEIEKLKNEQNEIFMKIYRMLGK
ncbi:plasmid mobilization relaxosome protein MobC [Epilithonimonas caeni]|uniref:plasmid mobilization relaxosome protein MobC n=1 Tax=Epilithonimonas caeni TaxID=365343 RepID=UPI0003F7CA99|nr:plasmid mobilization relaxosome protein MobC [Epilithonimonas caeni]